MASLGLATKVLVITGRVRQESRPSLLITYLREALNQFDWTTILDTFRARK